MGDSFYQAIALLRFRGGGDMQTDWYEGFTKYAVELGSVTMVYTPGFLKIGSGIQNLIGEDSQRHTIIPICKQ
jgi:hypothetical protein